MHISILETLPSLVHKPGKQQERLHPEVLQKNQQLRKDG